MPFLNSFRSKFQDISRGPVLDLFSGLNLVFINSQVVYNFQEHELYAVELSHGNYLISRPGPLWLALGVKLSRS